MTIKKFILIQFEVAAVVLALELISDVTPYSMGVNLLNGFAMALLWFDITIGFGYSMTTFFKMIYTYRKHRH